ncbi:GH20696 [Drosophila grimshawi]|uniref:Odorant receptor n=2 Tax=Drosophila grimshawi TaxID=7222 RepID=B4J720_DROGR|nr:GH20696 [Drosophila grimshawi]
MSNGKPDELRTYDDFIYVPNLIFKSMGYDFLDTPKPRWQKLMLNIYWTLCVTSHWYMVYYLILRTIEWDTLAGSADAIMRFAIIYFIVLNADVKFSLFMHHRRHLRELNDKLRALYPKEGKTRKEYRVNEFYWPFIARCEIYIYYFVVGVVVLGPIIQAILMYLYQRYTSDSEVIFLYLSTFPMKRFEVTSPMTYALSQCIEFIFSHSTMNIKLGTDIWMICFSGQLCMHFAHLGRKLASYNPSRQNHYEDCEFLVRLIRDHEQLLSLYKELNKIFGLMLAYNVFSTATILCCVAYYTILQGVTREGFGFLLYFFSDSVNFYMVCYYGQRLIDLSENIALAAYIHNWYNGSPTYQKYVLMIIQRAQRPAELSAKGVIIISRDSFKNMMSITYRFLAVVRRLLGK